MKLLDITRARDNVHKYQAVFLQDSGRKKTVKFGAVGYKDFIEYNKTSKEVADEHRRMYLTRHKKTEDWGNPMTAGALSRWILWEEPSLSGAVANFRRKFSL